MDISKRINILAFVLLAALMGLICYENFVDNKLSKQEPEQEFSTDIFKGSEGEEFVTEQMPQHQDIPEVKTPKKFTIVNKKTWMAPP